MRTFGGALGSASARDAGRRSGRAALVGQSIVVPRSSTAIRISRRSSGRSRSMASSNCCHGRATMPGSSVELIVKPGLERVRFGNPGSRLGYARDAVSSYFVFRTLREKGILPKGLRFQISIPACHSVIRPLYFPEPRRPAARPAGLRGRAGSAMPSAVASANAAITRSRIQWVARSPSRRGGRARARATPSPGLNTRTANRCRAAARGRTGTCTGLPPCSPQKDSVSSFGRKFARHPRQLPDTCIARSCNVIERPFRSGIFTSGGRYFATGSESATSPRRTMSASSSAVNTLVIEPISNRVSPSTGRGSPCVRAPWGTIRRPCGSMMPTTMPTPCR